MNILITGGTGLIGKPLVKKLTEKGHQVRILSRSKSDDPSHFYWNLKDKFINPKAFKNLDCIIHLAGATVSQRWTDSYKKELFSSRIDTADLLKEYLIKNKIHLKSFISASGINYYGTFTSDQILTEKDGVLHQDFLAKLTVDWENAAYNFESISDRIVCLRTAVVLAQNGGAFPLLKKTVDFNIGSGVGSGKQWMNWIHIEDLVNMYVYAVENTSVKGNYNAVSDLMVSNEKFMKILAEVCGKFFLPLNVPAFILNMMFGEMSSIILEGTRASNEKIKSLGFDFKYKVLEKAFENLI